MTTAAPKTEIRLDIGCGDQPLEGWLPIDRKLGREAYPLDFEDDTVDEIRASHVLEHFGHQEVVKVLGDWVRCLKPGGRIRIAVPDFESICRRYLAGEDLPIQGYVMGGQVDENDFHKTIFDREELRNAMQAVGLRQIRRWTSDQPDCASLTISLNLEGRKPLHTLADIKAIKIGAVMSVPRLGFQDNFFAAFEGLHPLGISLRKTTGAFWGQCLERGINEALESGVDFILTLDYDTVFRRDDVEELCYLALEHPDADAIAPIQASRSKSTPLFTISDGNGGRLGQIAKDDLDADLVRVSTAHFGLTLIRADAITKLKRPLFWGKPSEEGAWDDHRVDDDISFWQRFADARCKLCLAPRICVGHLELMIRWPGQDLQAFYQHPNDFWESGRPEGLWE